MKTKTTTTKRRKRRLRGKLSQQQRVLVHYFRYYGVREYTSAALDYLEANDRNRQVLVTEWWKSLPEWPKLRNANTHNFSVPFSTVEEAYAHLVERKLNMLTQETINGWQLYKFIPYKISCVMGYGKRRRTIWVKDLGTRL